MQLHQLPSTKRKPQRVGRSGKRGSYSGRGVKGQKSRSGRRIRPAERDLIMRLPKRRGFANKVKKEKEAIFNLKDLAVALEAHKGGSPLVLDLGFLKQSSLLPKQFRGEVKILGEGEVKCSLEVRGLKVSKNAKVKIEKAGGKIT